MNTDSQLKIQELWANKKCPIVNGIIYRNGVIKRFEFVRNRVGKSEKLMLKPIDQTTIIDFLSNEPDDVTSLSQLCEKLVLERTIRVVAGEGGWGGDGFIAVENLQTKELLFLLFFDNSNPFEQIDFVEPNIIVTSNLGEKWRIPIDEPERTKVFASQT